MIEKMEPIKSFNFERRFEAIVSSIDNFEDKKMIDVIIPELLISNSTDNETHEENIYKSNIVNANELDIKSYVISSNYVSCRPMVMNGKSIEEFIPQTGDIVTVEFYNGNPKQPYYYNGYLTGPSKPVIERIEREDIDDILNNYYRMVRLRQDMYMIGKDVDTMLSQLNLLGYETKKVNDRWVYDEYNERIVKKFQTDNGLKSDGIIGPITFTKIITNSRKKGYC